MLNPTRTFCFFGWWGSNMPRTKKTTNENQHLLDLFEPSQDGADSPQIAPQQDADFEHDYPNFPEIEAGILLKWADEDARAAELALDFADQAPLILSRLKVEVMIEGKKRRLIGQSEFCVALLKCLPLDHKVKVEYRQKADLQGLINISPQLMMKSKSDERVIQKATELCIALNKKPCSGQLIPDTVLSFSSATAGAKPSLNW